MILVLEMVAAMLGGALLGVGVIFAFVNWKMRTDGFWWYR